LPVLPCPQIAGFQLSTEDIGHLTCCWQTTSGNESGDELAANTWLHDRWAVQKTLTPSEVKETLLANQGKRVRITYDDGVVESVDVRSVDDEGCLHSGPNGVEQAGYWTRFESISDVQRDGQ